MRCSPHTIPNLKELFLSGLSHKEVLRIIEERPEFLKIQANVLRDTVDTLRSLGLGEGSLQNSASRYPALLSVTRSRLLAATQLLKNKCYFTSKQVAIILTIAPETMTQDLSHIENVFQYVYFRMGGNHREIISSQAFQTPLDEIKVRHQFLERLGKFQPPNKKRMCPASNPKVNKVIQLSVEDFLSHIAHSSPDELNTFRKIVEREEREGEHHMEDTEDELTDEEEDEQDSDSEYDDNKENVHDKPNHRHKKK